MPNSQLVGKRVVLAVTGSIAAYKAIGLLRLLTQQGATVHVVMTESATRFVAPLTFEVLSGSPVTYDLFSGHQDMKHLSLAEQADLLLVAPCTANTLAKLALGLADNVLGTMALTVQCPIVICPAMDGEMWAHPPCKLMPRHCGAEGPLLLSQRLENWLLDNGGRVDWPQRKRFWRQCRLFFNLEGIGKGSGS